MTRSATTTHPRLSGEDIRAHAVSCGRLDCGHLSRSTDLATRRACILYVAEGSGVTTVESSESDDTLAVLAILRDVQHARPTYVRGTLASGSRGYVTASPNALPLPEVGAFRVTLERAEVFSLLWQGLSATEVAALTGRALATVKSHAGYLRRGLGAHDATSALVALVLAGKIDARVPVPASDVIADAVDALRVTTLRARLTAARALVADADDSES